MKRNYLLYAFIVLIQSSCSTNYAFVNDLEDSFQGWIDKEQGVTVTAANSTEHKNMPWKPASGPNVVETYNFAFDEYNVSSSYIESIKKQAEFLQDKNYKLRIAGHADERGSREYNVSLGWKRAKAIAAYFQQYGVKSDQLVLVSYGKEKPLLSGHNPSAWAKNRRVEIFYEGA